jgi:hypothetical protein
LQGASALDKSIKKLNDPHIVVHVIWETVLASDSGPPITQTLARLSIPNTAQFWDPNRTLSKAMGEKPNNRKSITWDWVAVYPPGTHWGSEPPKPAWSGRPVVQVIPGFEKAVKEQPAVVPAS